MDAAGEEPRPDPPAAPGSGEGREAPKPGARAGEATAGTVLGIRDTRFTNGSSRGDPEERPRRSFVLHARRLFDQLDEEEREVVARAAAETHRAQTRKDFEFRHHFVVDYLENRAKP